MNHKRPAFTLIEMLVAMALTLFIMVIISQAFVTALEVFSGLKGIGDLQSNLRTASTLMQSDLAQDHFEGKRKLSDPNLLTDRPREGFFYIQISPNLLEGGDADGMLSYRSPQSAISKSDALYFTIKMRGNRRENFMSYRFRNSASPDFSLSPLVDVNYPRTNPLKGSPNFFNQPVDALFQDQSLTYNTQWAEVAWYLYRWGSTVEPEIQFSNLGTPLYRLYRAQYLLVPNNVPANENYLLPAVPAINTAIRETTKSIYLVNPPYDYSGVSCFPGVPRTGANIPNPDSAPPVPAPDNSYLFFASPADVADPPSPKFPLGKRTLTTRGETLTTVALNSTLVLNNVVSFHVRPMPSSGLFAGTFQDYYSLQGQIPPVVAPNSAPAPTTYDTSASPTAGIRALQIIIRAWDPNSQQTRQITIVQDM